MVGLENGIEKVGLLMVKNVIGALSSLRKESVWNAHCESTCDAARR